MEETKDIFSMQEVRKLTVEDAARSNGVSIEEYNKKVIEERARMTGRTVAEFLEAISKVDRMTKS